MNTRRTHGENSRKQEKVKADFSHRCPTVQSILPRRDRYEDSSNPNPRERAPQRGLENLSMITPTRTLYFSLDELVEALYNSKGYDDPI